MQVEQCTWREKRYACSIGIVDVPRKRPWCDKPITFSEEDMKEVRFARSDVVVIMENDEGAEVHRLLVDKGSSCDILSLGIFCKMRIENKNLKPCVGGLLNFT